MDQREMDVSPAPVTPDVIDCQATMTSAIRLAIQASGKDQKALYLDLEIDKGQWSRILSGQAHFPQDKLDQLCDLLGNEIPLEWWARRRGYELKPRETELERQNRELREELDRLKRDREVEIRLWREARS